MRIAVSGTHCCGKSTLVEDFLSVHPDYAHEPEPYEWMTNVYGEDAGDTPGIDEFYRQLEISVERLSSYAAGANVIAERSPLDFLAYMLALIDLRRHPRDCELIARAAELTATGLSHVDVLIVLSPGGIAAPAEEDLELRDAMNDRLIDLVENDEYSFFAGGRPRVMEIGGARPRRLRMLQNELRE